MTCLPEHLSNPLCRYEQYLHGRVKPATRIRQGNTVWRFLKLLEDRRSLSEYRPGDIERYRKHRLSEGVKPRTIASEVSVIRAFFR